MWKCGWWVWWHTCSPSARGRGWLAGVLVWPNRELLVQCETCFKQQGGKEIEEDISLTHIQMHAHKHTHIHIRTLMQTYTCMHTHIWIHTSVCIYTHTHTHINKTCWKVLRISACDHWLEDAGPIKEKGHNMKSRLSFNRHSWAKPPMRCCLCPETVRSYLLTWALSLCSAKLAPEALRISHLRYHK